MIRTTPSGPRWPTTTYASSSNRKLVLTRRDDAKLESSAWMLTRGPSWSAICCASNESRNAATLMCVDDDVGDVCVFALAKAPGDDAHPLATTTKAPSNEPRTYERRIDHISGGVGCIQRSIHYRKSQD